MLPWFRGAPSRVTAGSALGTRGFDRAHSRLLKESQGREAPIRGKVFDDTTLNMHHSDELFVSPTLLPPDNGQRRHDPLIVHTIAEEHGGQVMFASSESRRTSRSPLPNG